MREDRIQHDLIMWFGVKYPQYRNYLFMVHNETTSPQQGAKLKAMGLVSGVSDLIFINPNNGTVSGIELKAPNSIHKTEHVKRQLDWGFDIIKSSGNYIMTSDLNTVKLFIDEEIKGNFVMTDHNWITEQFHKKTIKF